MHQLHIIPDVNRIHESLKLAKAYKAVFEYNDFFQPRILEDKAELEKRINFYMKLERDRSKDTLHGAFLDIAVNSSDPRIRKISEYRVRQSMDIAARLGLAGVIFHTNYISNFRLKAYLQQWQEKSSEFIRKMGREYPGIHIYMENMFDVIPDPLADLAESLSDCENFGVCFDVAHANLSEVPLKQWFQVLRPYIRHFHINDNMGLEDSHEVLGAGNIDWFLVTDMILKTNASVLLEVGDMNKQQASLAYLEKNHINECF